LWQKNTLEADNPLIKGHFFIPLPEISKKMTTIIINERTKKGRIIVDLIREMGIGKIVEDKKESFSIPNNETIKAIQEAGEGKTIKCIDFDDYLQKAM